MTTRCWPTLLAFCAPWVFSAFAATRYVDINSANSIAPYTTWATAAVAIQDAVDASAAGDEIVVTNGLYQSGGRMVFDSLTNRVAVTMPITVRSVSGPEVTAIVGHQVLGTTNGASAVRCVYLANGARLIGFTLTNGATLEGGFETVGGGVRCESEAAVVSNCVMVANAADFHGGGAFSGTLSHCTLTGNFSYEGGGAAESTLNFCRLVGNVSRSVGSGALNGALAHCLIASNRNVVFGGGIFGSTATHCTIVGNLAESGGGGAAFATLSNCIVFHNRSLFNPAIGSNCMSCRLHYSCTTPLPENGVNNVTHEPAFVDLAGGDLRLRPTSPCINAGRNIVGESGRDLDGLPRIVGGAVDIGAYEFQSPTSTLSYAWLLQHGLPLDGSADLSDPDGDRSPNYQEWRAGTDPRDPASLLRLFPPLRQGANVAVSWQSTPNRTYTLEHGGHLESGFSQLATHLRAASGTNRTTFVHTNGAGSGPWFYRVGVEE